MFLIASTGRCGTMAISAALDRFTDHHVEHEPEPRLLIESDLKHRGLDHRTDTYYERMTFFAEREGNPYGETWRAQNLLDDVAEAAPRTRFLVLVRDPVEYVVSAHSKGVLTKGTHWDRLRLMPADDAPDLPLALRIASHWQVVNEYLLDFASTTRAAVEVAIFGPLDERIDGWMEHLGVTVHDRPGTSALLAERPNRSVDGTVPDGFDERLVRATTATTWDRAVRLASR
jgi:hypothetical protein